jgi:hypothetical protein
MYINVGLGEQPENYSWPITNFYLQGPTNNPYPDTVCLPMLTLPEAVRSRVRSGDLATIQIIQAAKHGAGLFSVSGTMAEGATAVLLRPRVGQAGQQETSRLTSCSAPTSSLPTTTAKCRTSTSAIASTRAAPTFRTLLSSTLISRQPAPAWAWARRQPIRPLEARLRETCGHGRARTMHGRNPSTYRFQAIVLPRLCLGARLRGPERALRRACEV